ncbi:MAG TPA: permease-like cell division protein FtsX [Solirubrobacteraceae bacterium]
MSVGFFTKEAVRSINRNAIPSFAAIASVILTVLVLGVFIPVVQGMTSAASEVRGRVLVDVYLKTNATDADAERVRQRLLDTRYVGNVEYVSKEQAYNEAKKENPEAYRLLGTNPLPDTFRIKTKDPDDSLKLVDVLSPQTASGKRTVIDPAIGKVGSNREKAGKVLKAAGLVKWLMFTLVALLIVASILLISNTIRLSLFSRRREVEVMKLVGATDWFIRWPFVIEGIVLGTLGGIVAVLLLGVAKVAILDPFLSDGFSLLKLPDTMPFPALTGLLLLAGITVSALGSGLSLRRFLRV